MPILSHVGRKHPRQIAMRVSIYALLTLGALSIVYPMLIVLGQTFSDSFDLRDNAIIPFYLRDRNELALKHIYASSNRVDFLSARHRRKQWKNQAAMRDDMDFYATRPAEYEKEGLNLEAWETVLADLNEFKRTLAPNRVLVKRFRLEDYFRPFLFKKYGEKADRLLEKIEAGTSVPDWLVRSVPEADERESLLENRESLGLAIMNHELRSDYVNFYSVEAMREGNWPAPFWRTGRRPKDALWTEFKSSLPPQQRLIIPSDAYWQLFLKMKYRNVDSLNEAWGTQHGGIVELQFSFEPPKDPVVRKDWEEFMRKRWPRRLLRVKGAYAEPWRAYVRKQLVGKFEKHADAETRALKEAGRLSGQNVEKWDDLGFPRTLPQDETLARYWCEFTASGTVQIADMELDAPLLRFRKFLREKYAGDAGDGLKALNAAWKTSYTSFDDVPLPLGLADYAEARFHPWRLRWSFMTESYERVAEYIFGRGRAAQNTLILVVLSLLSALTINPIAAYSLSRFSMKHSTKILIFFLATMAFPAEVAMIPNFLLLRDFGLLNTYAALVLPGMANGFAIFLLKGFFDSLPQELYQAAEIDGASEVQVFRLVALPLVKPILAYIGLNTFVAAYSSFMWAFVICPEQEMWTLMVWVYDFQTKNAGNNYVMAATVLVCIPPLIVFFFANRIIMKGIVIPSLK